MSALALRKPDWPKVSAAPKAPTNWARAFSQEDWRNLIAAAEVEETLQNAIEEAQRAYIGEIVIHAAGTFVVAEDVHSPIRVTAPMVELDENAWVLARPAADLGTQVQVVHYGLGNLPEFWAPSPKPWWEQALKELQPTEGGQNLDDEAPPTPKAMEDFERVARQMIPADAAIPEYEADAGRIFVRWRVPGVPGVTTLVFSDSGRVAFVVAGVEDAPEPRYLDVGDGRAWYEALDHVAVRKTMSRRFDAE